MNKGFTIVELLIVIVIIGVLGSIVVTTLSSIQEKNSEAEQKDSSCEMYSNWVAEDLPVGCYEYFKVKE